jgi:hypothetical protein
MPPMDEAHRGSAACKSRVSCEVDFMRWIVRDIGIFIYGCVFAAKYIFSSRARVQSEKQDAQLAAFVPTVDMSLRLTR